MHTVNEFVSENLPLDYRACFTLKIKNNCARIVGSIAVCDALGSVVAREDNIECDPQILLEAAFRLNERQPGTKQLFENIYGEIERIRDCEAQAVCY